MDVSTVSVVIPTRNDGIELTTCLALLARQTRPADEIIVVDNASTDDTAAICAAAGVRRMSVDLPGIPATAAAGFDAASGSIIARLDTDSRPPRDWLEHVERLLRDAGPCTAVTGPGDFYGGNPLIRWAGRYVFLGAYFRVIGFLLGHPPVYGSNFALRRELWAALSPSVVRDNALVHDDLDISYRLRPDMDVVYDPTLKVGVSARPFGSWTSFRRRVVISLVTFRVEFRYESPLRRRRDRALWRRGHQQPPSHRQAGG